MRISRKCYRRRVELAGEAGDVFFALMFCVFFYLAPSLIFLIHVFKGCKLSTNSQSLENVKPDQNTYLTHVSRTTTYYYENEDKKSMKWGETKWRTDARKTRHPKTYHKKE